MLASHQRRERFGVDGGQARPDRAGHGRSRFEAAVRIHKAAGRLGFAIHAIAEGVHRLGQGAGFLRFQFGPDAGRFRTEGAHEACRAGKTV